MQPGTAYNERFFATSSRMQSTKMLERRRYSLLVAQKAKKREEGKIRLFVVRFHTTSASESSLSAVLTSACQNARLVGMDFFFFFFSRLDNGKYADLRFEYVCLKNRKCCGAQGGKEMGKTSGRWIRRTRDFSRGVSSILSNTTCLLLKKSTLRPLQQKVSTVETW